MSRTTTPNVGKFGIRGKDEKGGLRPSFFARLYVVGVRISGHCILWPLRAHSRPAAAAALVPPSAGAYSWAAQGRCRVPLPPSVPAWLASIARGQSPGSAAIVPCSLRCARDLSGMRALPRPSPLLLAAPLPLAAAPSCGLRFGAAQSALCPAGPRGGPPAPAGRVGPSPSAAAALRLAAAAGGALPWLRFGSGCVSSPSPRSARAASAPALRPPGSGRPLGLPPPRFSPACAPAAGRAALGLRPRWPRLLAPPRGVVSSWGCRGGAPAGAGVGIPPPAGGGDNRPPWAGGVEHLRRHFHIFIVQQKGKGNDHAQHLSQSIHAGI